MKCVRKYKLVPVEEEEEGMNESAIISLIPKNMKSKARMLIDYMRRIPEIGWNEKGQVTIGEEILGGSHIADFIKACLFEYKNAPSEGFDQFYQLLRNNNVPESLLARRVVGRKWIGF